MTTFDYFYILIVIILLIFYRIKDKEFKTESVLKSIFWIFVVFYYFAIYISIAIVWTFAGLLMPLIYIMDSIPIRRKK